jgi:hypothetical protein
MKTDVGIVPGYLERVFGKNWITKFGGMISMIGGLVAVLPDMLEFEGHNQWAAFIVSIGAAISGFGSKSYNQDDIDNRDIENSIKQEVQDEENKYGMSNRLKNPDSEHS